MNVKELEIIKQVAQIIAQRIINENIKGACSYVPFILKVFLKRFYNITINVLHGVIEYEGNFSSHVWNSFENKLIDITIHNQLEDGINSNCIILDNIYISKDNKIDYHLSTNLPKKYLDFIGFAEKEERKYQQIINLNNKDNEYLKYLTNILNTDGVMFKMDKIGINDIKKTTTYLKNRYKKEMNDYFKYIKESMKIQ